MLAATVLGLRLRARAGVGGPSAASVLAFAAATERTTERSVGQPAEPSTDQSA
ncbi:hypothetical protein [Kitasatospora sp. NPDC093806]|uniref:hypothetical protein n=1 Tax=Kitasatospora sp. NPDC093806 TaxID=3155075 RepID=UPI003431CC1B